MSKYIIAIFLFCALTSNAQFEIGLFSQQNNIQKALINPSYVSADTFVVGLPSLMYRSQFNGPTYGDFLSLDGGNASINADDFLSQLVGDNFLWEGIEINTLQLSYRFKDIRFSLGHRINYNVYAAYTNGLPAVAFKGNAPFIGQIVDLKNDIAINASSQWQFGVAYPINDQLSIGTNIRYLNGSADISTSKNLLSLYTDPDVYQLTLESDYQLNTTAALELNPLDTFDISAGTNDLQAIRAFSGNNGIGIDVGLTYRSGNFIFEASAINIGSISWDETPTNYKSTNSATFDGIDIAGIITGEDTSLNSIVDTVEQIFAFERSTESYQTQLAPRFFGGITWQKNDQLSAGLLVMIENYREQSIFAVGLQGQYALNDQVSLGANYSIVNGSADNLGLNGQVQLGPVQIFAMTNNVLHLINGNKSRNFSGRVGLNLLLK